MGIFNCDNFKRLLGLISLVVMTPNLASAQLAPQSESLLRSGLQALFSIENSTSVSPKNNTDLNHEDLVASASHFYEQYRTKIASTTAPVVDFQKKKRGNMWEFSFPSLMQREAGHPSNLVRGFVYFPNNLKHCNEPIPATLLLHHVADDIGPEKQLASLAASSDKGIVMVIYLPHYGPRKGDRSFIVNDEQEFKTNILQSLLDIHQSARVLKQFPEVNPNRLSLMGISLGAIITLINAGFDQHFHQYLALVGGPDLAKIMSYRTQEDPDSDTSKALKGINWTEQDARVAFSSFDAFTRAHFIRNKKFVLLNAEKDELISKSDVLRLAEIYRKNGNLVDLRFHNGTHRPDLKSMGIWGFIRKIIFPIFEFIGEGSSINCQPQNY